MKSIRSIAALILCFVILLTAACSTSEPPKSEAPASSAAETPASVNEIRTYDETVTWNGIYDVIVVGFGGAGAVSAITAADEGASVLLLEKAPLGKEGGNTRVCVQAIMATDDYDAALTYHKALRAEWLRPSDEVLEAYVKGLTENKAWLESIGGKNITDSAGYEGEWPELPGASSSSPLYVEGEASTGRFWQLIRANVMERSDKIDVWYEAPGVELIQDPNTNVIIGVIAEVEGKRVNLRARNGVVLATGGFEANQQMIQDYLGLPEGYPMGTTYNTGDGITMAMAVGADLWHMDNVMGPFLRFIEPTTNRSMTLGVLGTGEFAVRAIAVGPNGTRFCDETARDRHGYISFYGRWIHRIMCLPSYVVFDDETRATKKIFSTWSEGNVEEIEKGWIIEANTLEELAKKIEVDPAALVNTVKTYNEYCKEGKDSDFGRAEQYLNAIGNGPYYAIELKPAMVNTQGGPVRNENAEVINTNGNPIPHLYSAGELGSIHGHYYQGAGNIAECIVFGRIAGKNAAEAKAEQPSGNLKIDRYTYTTPVEEIELGENEYLGTGTGIGGDLKVKVTVKDGKILSVEIVSQTETVGVADNALKLIPQRIVEANSTEVDIVSGATQTSKAIMSAVADALSKQ